jgi:hypothetical protein
MYITTFRKRHLNKQKNGRPNEDLPSPLGRQKAYLQGFSSKQKKEGIKVMSLSFN